MVDFNRRFACTFRSAAAVALILFFHAGTAHAGLVLDSWTVSACAGIGFGSCFLPDKSSSTDPFPRTATQASQVGDSTASAYQSPGGWDSAGARLGADLDPSMSGLSASARFSIVVSNTGPGSIPLDFRFLIFGGRLEIGMTDFAALFNIPTSTVIADLNEITPVGSIPFWSYKGILAGANSFSFPGYKTVLVDPQGIGMPGAVVSQDFGAASVDLDTFGGTLNLGSIAPGETRKFSYQLFAQVNSGTFFDNTGGSGTAPPPQVTGFAELEDPFGFGTGFFLNGVSFAELTGVVEGPPVSGVPGPPTWLIFASALTALALLRRSRRA